LTCKAADSAATTATWLKLSPATSPPARSGPGMAYDPVQKLVVLFGGIALGHKPEYLSDTWAFNGTTWAELQPADSPPPRQQAGMAYDFAAKQIVLFSGIGRNSTTLFDTWTWDGTNWAKMQPSGSQPGFPSAPLFPDPKNGHVEVFTETAEGAPQTWQWSGSDWLQLSPADSPPPRQGAVASLDNAAGVVVLYGGVNSSLEPLTDTWSWDGENWTQLSPTAQPGSASNLNAVYDPQLKGIVMLAGSEMGETWEWNRNTHHFGSYCQSPPPRVPGLQSAAAMLVEKTDCPMSRPRLET
jgi:hypothetical protein